MAKVVLTAVADDREGLVAALASAVADHGGNWLESEMARLAGKFAGIVLVEVDDAKVDELVDAMDELGALEVRVTRADSPADADGDHLSLHLVGQDRPGIVREVARTLAGLGITIDELATDTVAAPMGDGTLFEADARIRLPEGVEPDAVREALEAIATELMVDLDLA